MNDLFDNDPRYRALLERIEALEAVVYQHQRTERVKVEEPLNEAWQLWNRHRNGKGWTAKARELSMKKLRELAGTDGTLALKIVEQSIEHGYRGLFPLKTQSHIGQSSRGFGKPTGAATQRHKTVAEAFAPTETRDENQRAWESQQRMYGR